MKLVTIVGARPQFIKSAPFSDMFRKGHKEIIIHTGQHYDENMSDIFFQELAIPKPDYFLGVGSGSHGYQTGRMLEKIEQVLLKEKPDGVLVYGDTNSTLAGALAASKLHIPVFHVEAGLRSYNKQMPEEQNRILTDHISDLLFCPTKTAVENLKREGILDGVLLTGDIMADAVNRFMNLSNKFYSNGKWLEVLKADNPHLPQLKEKEYYLATVHRAENTDDLMKLKCIFTALEMLDQPVLVPLHPRTRKLVGVLNISFENVIIIQPVGYLLMLYLTKNAYMVVTDSGGLQKEAYLLKTPCTTLRNETEWIETLENGWNCLCPINIQSILEKASRNLDSLNETQPQVFGDGKAALRICQAIVERYA